MLLTEMPADPGTAHERTPGQSTAPAPQPSDLLSSAPLPPSGISIPGVREQTLTTNGKTTRWIDLTVRSRAELRDALGRIGVPADDLLTVPIVELNQGRGPQLQARSLTVHLGKDLFVTAHMGPLSIVERSWAKAQSQGITAPIDILLRILNRIPKAGLDAVSCVEKHINALDERCEADGLSLQETRKQARPMERALESIGDALRHQTVMTKMLRLLSSLVPAEHHAALDGIAQAIDAVGKHAQHERSRTQEIIDRVTKRRAAELAERGAVLGDLQKNLAIFRGLTAPLLCIAGAVAGAAGGSWPVVAVCIAVMVTGLYLSRGAGRKPDET